MGRQFTNGVSRRRVLQGSSCAFLASLIPQAVTGSNGEVLRIGDFESGLDGWKTNGRATLTRASDDDVPAVVTHGEHALRVDAERESSPGIRRQLTAVDLVDHPYFLADVYVGNVPDSDAPVRFKLAYRYDRGGGRTNGGRGEETSRRGAPIESTTIELPQGYRNPITWDLSTLGESKRRRPVRLELRWRNADVADQKSSNGQGDGQAYGGDIFFDDIRFSNEQGASVHVAMNTQVSQLVAEHGAYVYEFESKLSTGEAGTFVFHDGTEVPVTVDITDGEEIRIQIGSEEYRLGGGAA